MTGENNSKMQTGRLTMVEIDLVGIAMISVLSGFGGAIGTELARYCIGELKKRRHD